MVSAPVARALSEMGYAVPTPIQEAVIEPMLHGHDVVGQAQTGTGKTCGFGIPLAERVDGTDRHVQAMVLVPTRELARQVSGELSRIIRYRGIRLVAVYGGAPMAPQIKEVEAGAQIVVGTPGRIIDLLDRRILQIGRVQTVILDEADQMLDIGFLPDIRRILRSTPRDRQTALFTATVPTMIRRLIYSYLRDPQWVRVGKESEPVDTVRQMYCEVAQRDKLEAMIEVLDTIGHGEQTLVFRRTKEDVDWLVRALKRRGLAVEAIHGGLPQGRRNAVMQAFRDGELRLLVSTNLTSRGLTCRPWPTSSTTISPSRSRSTCTGSAGRPGWAARGLRSRSSASGTSNSSMPSGSTSAARTSRRSALRSMGDQHGPHGQPPRPRVGHHGGRCLRQPLAHADIPETRQVPPSCGTNAISGARLPTGRRGRLPH